MFTRVMFTALALTVSSAAQASFYDICEFDAEVKGLSHIGRLGGTISSNDNLGPGMIIEVLSARVRTGHTDCQGYVGSFHTVTVSSPIAYREGDRVELLYDTKSGLTPSGVWFSDTWSVIEKKPELPIADVELRGARLDQETSEIVLDVAYTGGCGEHKFTIDAGACFETFPVQCRGAELVHRSDDTCEAYISETVRLSLKDAGLADSYFNGAFITLRGTNGGKYSFKLPLNR